MSSGTATGWRATLTSELTRLRPVSVIALLGAGLCAAGIMIKPPPVGVATGSEASDALARAEGETDDADSTTRRRGAL